jgi:predicted N-formylglutamate amidohydrolase
VPDQALRLEREPVALENAQGRGSAVIVCDHASNWVPPVLGGLGLPAAELERHIAWDPGALPLARRLAQRLDAPLVHATVSRLVLDVNRDPDHAGSIVMISEDTEVPGNRALSTQDRLDRVRSIYEPYHECLAHIVGAQLARHRDLAVVSVHSFTPVYRGLARPWHMGVLSADDRRIADPLLDVLRAERDLNVGDNQPYGPDDGVYHTLDRHCGARKVRSVLIEVRADLISGTESQDRWAERLARALAAVEHAGIRNRT